MNVLQNSWNNFRGTVRGFDTPHQLGLGMAFGVLAGLIPVDSAIPYLVGIVALLSTANLLCFGIGAVAAHFVSPSLDHLTHVIGTWVLTLDPLEPAWSTLAGLPAMPWTRFNNSVVMGTLVLGLLAGPPFYTMTRITSHRMSRWLGAGRNSHPTIAPPSSTAEV